MPMMKKKTYYYNFIPTKAEEEAAEARNIPHQLTRTLVEMNDIHFPSAEMFEASFNPWPIRKSIGSGDINTEKIKMSHNEVFDHVFRYWTFEAVNNIVMGGCKYLVQIFDFTDEKNPKGYSEHISLEKSLASCTDEYELRWTELARSRLYNTGDEIGLVWNSRSGCFHFKLLHRAS